MAKTIESVMSEAKRELADKPTLKQFLALMRERPPYTGPPIAPIVRQDRDAH